MCILLISFHLPRLAILVWAMDCDEGSFTLSINDCKLVTSVSKQAKLHLTGQGKHHFMKDPISASLINKASECWSSYYINERILSSMTLWYVCVGGLLDDILIQYTYKHTYRSRRHTSRTQFNLPALVMWRILHENGPKVCRGHG